MGRRRRPLSEADRSVWDQVARSVTPLPRNGPKLTTPHGAIQPKEPVRQPDPVPLLPVPVSAPARPGPSQASTQAGSTRFDLAMDPVTAHLMRAPAMDQRIHNRLRRGRIEPERRIDLHGMTLVQAERALKSFILSSHVQNVRVTLVITGKGRTGPAEDPGPIPQRRGAIRHAFLGWLSSPPLAGAVLDVVQASPRHGGGGAFYVYLRRRR